MTPTVTATPEASGGPELVIEDQSGIGDSDLHLPYPAQSWNVLSYSMDTQIDGFVLGHVFEVTNGSSCILKRMDSGVSDLWGNTSDNLQSATYLSMPNWASAAWSAAGINQSEIWIDQAAQSQWIIENFGFPVHLITANEIANEDDPAIAALFQHGYNWCSGTVTIDALSLIGWGAGEPSATPMPSPTPQIVDYCGTVNGVTGGSSELGISLPEFGIGSSTCYGLSEIVLPTSIINFFPGINIEDVTIPGIELCFTEISFGTLDLFGVAVNLDSIANLLAAALIIRWLLRS